MNKQQNTRGFDFWFLNGKMNYLTGSYERHKSFVKIILLLTIPELPLDIALETDRIEILNPTDLRFAGLIFYKAVVDHAYEWMLRFRQTTHLMKLADSIECVNV